MVEQVARVAQSFPARFASSPAPRRAVEADPSRGAHQVRATLNRPCVEEYMKMHCLAALSARPNGVARRIELRRWVIRLSVLAVLGVMGCGSSEPEPQPGGDVLDGDTADHDETDGSPEAEVSEDVTLEADADSAVVEPLPEDTLPLNGVAQDVPACAIYANAGPHAVGVRTIVVEEVPVEIFYPAPSHEVEGLRRDRYDMRTWLPEDERDKISDDDAPLFVIDAYRDVGFSDAGPFPVVVFSHGLAGYRFQSATLLVHLASWGYVVVSADHVERGLARIVEALVPARDQSAETVVAVLAMLDEAVRDASELGRSLDMSRVAMTGHSAGGGTTFAVLGLDDRFSTYIVYAAGRRGSQPPPEMPGLLLAGETDGVIALNGIRNAYVDLAPPKRFISIADAGHLAFSDICVVGREDGGILQIAADNGIEVNPLLINLGADGCRTDDLAPERAWPVIHHISVAHLRDAFAQDAHPVALDDELDDCFGALIHEHAFEGTND